MADIVLKDRDGNPVEHATDTVRFLMSDGTLKKFVNMDSVPDPLPTTVNLDFSDGDMVVAPEDGTVFSEVRVPVPSELVPANIPEGMFIAGVGPGEFKGESGSGGVVNGTGENLVRVIDYDGTVLSLNYLDEGEVFTLPDGPAHNGLIFDGWSAPVTITDNTVTVPRGEITIGPMYHTASGATELDIELVQSVTSGLTFTFYSADGVSNMTGMTSIDWGDGTVTGSDVFAHTYAAYGKYTIKIYGMTGVSGTSNSVCWIAAVCRYTIKEVRFAAGVTTVGAYACSYWTGLTSVSFPCDVSSLGSYAFQYCYCLRSITIPYAVKSLPSSGFQLCYSLTYVAMSPLNSFTGIPSTAFASCYSLKSLTNSGAYFSSQSCYQCYSLSKVTCLKSVSQVYANAFYNCYALKVLDFAKNTAVPTLQATNALTNINSSCQIRVPSSLYSSWRSASNWSSKSSHIVKA